MHFPPWKTYSDSEASAERKRERRALSRRSFAGFLGMLVGAQPLRAAGGQSSNAAEDKPQPTVAGHETSPPTQRSPVYQRMKAYLNSVTAIDTHAHLLPFEDLTIWTETDHGRGANLYGLWSTSYFYHRNLLTPWKPGMAFDDWWRQAKASFLNCRSLGFYRHLQLAFQDLYGVNFSTITDEQARDLDRRIFENYQNQKWLYDVITRRANIAVEFDDPYWARFGLRTTYDFSAIVFNVTPLIYGPHPQTLMPELKGPLDEPAAFARQWGLPVDTIDDYLVLIDRMFQEAKQKGALCLKTTVAYERTLQFDVVPKERAARAFAGDRSQLSPADAKALEDYLMWRLPEFSAKYNLPFQIHTGLAQLSGSNPLNLEPLIKAHPQTRFILFHGGFPWVGELGALAYQNDNVWLDCNWVPMLSYTTATRAFHEWLDLIPSNRIMWGTDCKFAEEIYGATELMRRAWAQVLAERVEWGFLDEPQAQQIGRQILRENALEMFPQLRERLEKQQG